MKKLLFAALLAACALSLAAQELTDTGALTMDISKYSNVGLLNVESYAQKVNNDINFVSKAKLADMPRAIQIAGLNSAPNKFDTAEEIALLSATAGVINIRPVEAAGMLPAGDSALVDLQLGAMLYMKKAAVSFLGGGDPAKYAAEIKFITDRGRVTEANIRDFVKQGIASVVREKFNSIDFRLEKYQKSYAATLSIDPKTSEYILNYGVYDNNEKKISGRNLDALLITMKSNVDFDARSIERVETMANLIPAVVYGSWVEKKITNIDAVQLAADTIANFYISPTSANYDLLVGVFGLFNRDRDDPLAEAGLDAYDKSLVALNAQLGEKAGNDSLSKGAALARAARAYNPDYAIFATPYRK